MKIIIYVYFKIEKPVICYQMIIYFVFNEIFLQIKYQEYLYKVIIFKIIYIFFLCIVNHQKIRI